jgi:large subunit ribosomal protein L24
MKIKIGDTVIVISGSRNDRKKIGKVISMIKKDDLILVEGVNLKNKVSKDASGKKSIVKVEFPIHVSNVMFYDEKAKAGTRLAIEGTGKEKHRVTKKSKTALK